MSISIEAFSAYDGRWTNSQMRAAEMRMLGAVNDIMSAIPGTVAESYFSSEGKALTDLLSSVRNSIPDDGNSTSPDSISAHNNAAVEFVSYVNTYGTGDNATAMSPTFLGELGDALVSTPATILGGAGTAIGGGVSSAVTNFFKSLSWVVWVVLALVAIGLAFWYIPGLKAKVFG